MADSEQENADFLKGVEAVDLSFMEKEPYKHWNAELQKRLNTHRYRHTLGVVRTAIFLADRYGVDREKAGKAALLHDCAKKNEESYFKKLLADGVLKEEDWQPSPVYHAHLGAYVAREYYGEKDPDIFQAIYRHSTGGEDMTALDQVIFLADMIEPSRNFPGLPYLRACALKSLDLAAYKAMNHSLLYLLNSDQVIIPDSLSVRNSMLKKLQRQLAQK